MVRDQTRPDARRGAMTATVVVATYNRASRLQRLLAALDGEVNDAEFDVVVVNDGSTDGTRELLKDVRPKYRLRAIDQPNAGPSAARNRGIAEASGELVVFLDDDVIPVRGLMGRHIDAHHAGDCSVVIGPMLKPPERRLDPWLEWEADTLAKQYRAMQEGVYPATPRQFYTANASVRREHIVAIGGFDERIPRAEDVELAYRLDDRGLRFVFLPDAPVYHDPVRSFESWLNVAYEYGRMAVVMHSTGRSDLAAAYEELPTRHPLNRVVPRALVGHRARSAVVGAMARGLMPRFGRRLPRRLRMAACSLLFSTRYWQGIADASGAGRRVWHQRPAVEQTAPANQV